MPWRGEGARRAKRENARRKKRRVPAPLSRKRWLPSLSFLPRGAKEKKNERGLLDLLLLRPATSRGAEGMTSARLSRSRREQRDKGRGSKRVQRLVIRSLTHHPASERSERWQCIHQISLFSLSTLEKTALTRPSAVPGWRVPRRPPLLVRVAKKKKKWGRRGVKRKKLSLSLKSEEKKNVRGREETEEHLDDDDEEKPSLFTFSFFPALVRSAEEPSVRRAAFVLLLVPSSW